MSRGERKLTDEQAREIRFAYRRGCPCCGSQRATLGSLGAQYGLSAPAIHALVHGKSYKTAGGPIVGDEQQWTGLEELGNDRWEKPVWLDDDAIIMFEDGRMGRADSWAYGPGARFYLPARYGPVAPALGDS